jgi:sulfate transport system permease protein
VRKSFLPTNEPLWIKFLLIGTAFAFLLLLVLLPVIAIFMQAFAHGIEGYVKALTNYEMIKAIQLTLKVTAIVLFLNVIFGLTASWAIGKFDFIGKPLLISLIDLPLSVSPVIAGLIYVLLFSNQEYLGELLDSYNIKIIFATPGIVIATLFITFPYVARELIPLIEQLGNEEEEAALLLGANGMKTYFRITLPNIKWGLLYGVLLCAARALGEFGAVSVVSGHIQGLTNTLPLHIEVLYNEYNFVDAFAASSILTVIAVITIVLKPLIEWRSGFNQYHKTWT